MNQSKLIKIFIVLLLLFVQITAFAQESIIASGENGMAATAHPLASEAAIEMLKKGGNAIDAAVAAAFTIGVVEPDGSGLGGGGGMVIYLNDQKKSFYINYYQRASENAGELNFDSATDRISAKSILIPGTVAGLTLALIEFGKLSLSEVLEPAVRYAEQGFTIDATLGTIILDNVERINKDSSTASIYFEDDFPRMEGDTIVQPELANTLREISKNGRAGFYEGKIAQRFVDGISARGGVLTLDDFKSYQAELTEPISGNYRGYDILSANVPQSGSTVIQALNMLENVNLTELGHYSESAQTLHLMAETFRRVYADRSSYLGDRYFGYVPVAGLVSKDYAQIRFNDINHYQMQPASYRATQAGNPAKYDGKKTSKKYRTNEKKIYQFDDKDDASSHSAWGEKYFDSWGAPKNIKQTVTEKEDSINVAEDILEEDTDNDGHTTHLSVIDRDGNAVALTQTLGTFFGSGQTIAGVLFNCGMTNYSKTIDINLVEPRKQPRSSIAPTIVLKENKPFLVIGSPGASRIISTVIELIVNVIDFDMDIKEANNAPRFYTQKYVDYLHLEGGISETVQQKIESMGHPIKVYEGIDLYFGGAQMIYVDQNGVYYGSADPRRGGKAIGY